MERVQSLIDSKQRIFNAYSAGLEGLPLLLNPQHANTINGYWMPTIMVNESVAFNREILLEAFKSDNIDGRVFFWPLSDTGHFNRGVFTGVAHGLFARGVNLPSYHDLEDEEITRVCKIIHQFFNQSN
jgi:perosamine synthetase